MTALERLIAELRKEAALPVPMVAPAALTTILGALEAATVNTEALEARVEWFRGETMVARDKAAAAEQRAETLRGALESLRGYVLRYCQEPDCGHICMDCFDVRSGVLAEVERSLKGEAHGGG